MEPLQRTDDLPRDNSTAMRLLIVSHTPHYERDTQIVGWGPTVREIDHLAQLFSSVTHVAPLYSGSAPGSSLAYTAENVHLRPVRPAGGERWRNKLAILIRVPSYIRIIWSEMRRADVVHVRCPANISLVAALLLACTKQPRRRWIKYAGNWQPSLPEAWSYTFQRWWLRKGPHGAEVTVNGDWPCQPPHVRPFYNPSLTDAELAAAREIAASKHLSSPLRLLYVGRLERAKGVERALRIVAALSARGMATTLDLVGDGPERGEVEALVRQLGLTEHARLYGWIARPELVPFYAAAHIMLFPSSSSEGWPKVLSEAMAYGVVPVTSNVSGIPQALAEFGCGVALPADRIEGFVEAVIGYVDHAERWAVESRHASDAAIHYTYGDYLRAVSEMLAFGVSKEGKFAS